MRILPTLAVLLIGGLAEAPTYASAPPVEAAVHVGYAREIDPSVRGDLGPYRYGFGVRGGVLFGHLWVGASLTRFVGTTQRASGPGSSYDAHYDLLTFGPEIGWDFRIGEHVLVRPIFGGGLQRIAGHTTVQGLTLDEAYWRYHLNAAVLGAYRVGPAFFGPELRFVAAPLDLPGAWAPWFSLVGGARF